MSPQRERELNSSAGIYGRIPFSPNMSELKFSAFTSQIELPFYSALFSSKLDHDKLDDSARFVLGTYESSPLATPEESTRMQILGNALTSNAYVADHSPTLVSPPQKG